MKIVIPCLCGSGLAPEAQFDGYGIYLTVTCPKCHKEKMAEFRPDIHERYDCDEPIEPEE